MMLFQYFFASYSYVVSIFNLPDRYAIPIIMLSIYKQVEQVWHT
jgi:hypothetical protein